MSGFQGDGDASQRPCAGVPGAGGTGGVHLSSIFFKCLLSERTHYPRTVNAQEESEQVRSLIIKQPAGHEEHELPTAYCMDSF